MLIHHLDAASLDGLECWSKDETFMNNAATIATLPLELRAMTATFNTAELLEHILSYIPAHHLFRAKATSRTFRDTIEASPTLCRELNTFIRLDDVDEDNLYTSNAKHDVVFLVKDLEPMVIFYPSDAERRIFIRFSTSSERFGMLHESNAFRRLFVLDRPVERITVGWHCSCFENPRSETDLNSKGGKVTFEDIFAAMKSKHEGLTDGACNRMVKFWLDGRWDCTKEVRGLG